MCHRNKVDLDPVLRDFLFDLDVLLRDLRLKVLPVMDILFCLALLWRDLRSALHLSLKWLKLYLDPFLRNLTLEVLSQNLLT